MESIEELLNNACSISKVLINGIVKPGDIVVDATLGAGHDSLFLSELIGSTGKIYAFDLQEQAINSAKQTLENANCAIEYINDSHANIVKHLKDPIKLAIFNLGYLPGSNKAITTTAESTVAAVDSLLNLLEKDGVVVLVIYRGHDEGKREHEAIFAYTRKLPQNAYNVAYTDFINQKNNPPVLLTIQKR